MSSNMILNKLREKNLNFLLAFIKAHLMVDRILKSIDLDKFEEYQKKFRNADPDSDGYSKYLNIRPWMIRKLISFYLLKLNKSEPLNILDLGAGAGFFPYICAIYGHKVVALDLDDVPMYNELCKFFKIDRRTWRIEKFQSLPDLGIKFDLVTAIQVKFNQHNCPDQWNVDEWKFFIDDLKINQLRENGGVFLQLNANIDGSFYDRELLKLFKNYGGKVFGRFVNIKFNDLK